MIYPSPDQRVLHASINGFGAYRHARDLLSNLRPDDATVPIGLAPHTIAELVGHMHAWLAYLIDLAEGRPVGPPTSAQQWPKVPATQWDNVRDAFVCLLDRAHDVIDQRSTAVIQGGPWQGFSVGAVLMDLSIHHAYHLGQIVTLRQQLRQWPPTPPEPPAEPGVDAPS